MNYQSTRQGTKQVADVNYLSKDFDSIKSDLIDYLRRYFPDDYQDFNEASGGMAILELLAYIGDSMSFYIDRQVSHKTWVINLNFQGLLLSMFLLVPYLTIVHLQVLFLL